MSPCCGGNLETERSVNKPRGCTNVLCLLIFCVFWGVLIFVAAFAFVIGDPTRLAYGQDSFGNTCGRKNSPLGNLTFSGMDMTARPYLFYLNMTDIRRSLKICIKKCPNETLFDEYDVKEFEGEYSSSLCRYDIASFKEKSKLYPAINNNTIERIFMRVEENSGHRPCPVPPVLSTRPLFNRCIPTAAADLGKDVVYNIYAYLNSFDTMQQVVSDIYAGKYEILGMICLSLILSFTVACTIHYVALFVSWIIMIVTSIAAIVATGILWWTYASIKRQLDRMESNQLLSESVQNERAFLIYSILSTVFTICLILIVIALRKRVQSVVQLFKEAGQCVRSMPCLLLQPLWTFICLVVFFVFWVAVLLALATAYYPVKNEVKSDIHLTTPLPTLPTNVPVEQQEVLSKAFSLVSFNQSSWVQYMWWYHLIALVWTSEFILGCQQMVIAGAVASWFFTRDRSTLKCPVGRSVKKLVVYHMGSVILGSFLITLFKIPRIILTYISSKLKQYENSKVIACCLKCCTCCLWCLEKCIRYLNHNAYTVIAIQGVGFCTAAREAFEILVSNAVQVAAINSVGDFILYLGKCGVTATTTFVGILIMKNDPNLHFYAIPVFLVSVFSFFISHCVLSVYEMVIDTLFLCHCEDLLKNDGSKERPYYGGNLVSYMKGNYQGEPLQPLRKPENSELKD